jgi:hypothetical protein
VGFVEASVAKSRYVTVMPLQDYDLIGSSGRTESDMAMPRWSSRVEVSCFLMSNDERGHTKRCAVRWCRLARCYDGQRFSRSSLCRDEVVRGRRGGTRCPMTSTRGVSESPSSTQKPVYYSCIQELCYKLFWSLHDRESDEL